MKDAEGLRKASRWAWLGVAVLLLPLIPIFGPSIEGKFFPPVPEFEIDEAIATDGGVLVSGSLYKARPNCHPLQLTAHGITLKGHNGEILFFADQDHPVDSETETRWRSRPGGWQKWGPWLLKAPQHHIDVISIRVVHRCHVFWTIETELFKGLAPSIVPSQSMLLQRGLAPIVRD